MIHRTKALSLWRANPAHCLKLAELMGQKTRPPLIKMANDYLEQAGKLEEAARKQ